jgi:predicted HD superfamily hydrolase involved in NAD metabolism
MNYGIANTNGKPSEEKSFSILQAALDGGITALDTARAYGDSEQVIGRFLKQYKGATPAIVTKIRKLEGSTPKELEKFVTDSIETSLENLGVNKVDAVMLHGAKDPTIHGRACADAVKSLLDHGYTDQVGVSVYTAEDISEMLRYDIFSVTQAPISIFDQRLIACGAVDALKDRGYTVFVRSVFLQGLFFLDPDKLEDPILQEYAADKIRLVQRIARENRLTEDESILESAALLHSVVGAHLARVKYGCEDEEIIAAILSHTTGKAGMSKLAMAVWLADTIEPTRAPYPLLDKTRMLAGLSLEKAMIASLEGTLQHVRKKGYVVHSATVETLDWLKTLQVE